MDNEGSFLKLEKIEVLLNWQYKFIIDFDYFLTNSLSRYDHKEQSIFVDNRIMFDRAFIGQTILRLSTFRQGIGKDLIIKNKPINDFLDFIEIHDKVLTSLKEESEPLDYSILQGIKIYHRAIIVCQVSHVLSTITDLIIDREYDYVINLNINDAIQVTRKKLLQLESSRLLSPKPCYLRGYYREKEHKLYELFLSHLTVDEERKERLATQAKSFTTIAVEGDGNIINTGDYGSIQGTINGVKMS